tara:strand:- start:175 stop:858 length:684 start_codon:yes stop_codon:yes gene_type:complete
MKLNLKKESLRKVNSNLQNIDKKLNQRSFTITNPDGNHAICAGLKDEIEVTIDGHAGYYCAGMNMNAHVTINGNVGTGVAENMMSGTVHVKGNASQSAGATAHGGTLIIEGDTSSRCGISMKGIDIIVKGSVGHMSAFMAQSGNLVICGNAGDALGDSIYEAKIFVSGNVKSLGADCEEKNFSEKDKKLLKSLLHKSEITDKDIKDFKMYGSARKLYNFNIDNVSEY